MNAFLLIAGFELWHVAGWTMLHLFWLGTLVALVAGVCRIAVRRGGPNLRYALAVGTLVVLALLPVEIAAWLIGTSPPHFPSQHDGGVSQPLLGQRPDDKIIELAGRELTLPTDVALAATDVTQDLSTSANQHAGAFTPPEILEQGQPLAPDAELVPFSSQLFQSLDAWVPYLPWVWLVGAPITFGLLATGMIGTRRLRRASRAIEDGPIAELLARLSASMRVGKHVGIAVCERIAAPVLIGIVRPIILLPPAALTGWSPDEIEMVLLHELAHVRRWDNAVNLAQRIVESLLFFHPAVWLVSNWIRREREACCDWVVVGRTNRPHAYAELLVALAAQMPRSVLFHPAASSAMAAGPLRKRIRRILQLEDDPMLVSGKSFVMVLASLLVATTLAVLYLPSIGQAEESATQATESTTEPEESTTEDTEVTEKNGKSQNAENDSGSVELSAQELQIDMPTGWVSVEAGDDPDHVRLRSSQDTPDESGGGHDENVFVAYTVPQHLMPNLEKWAELMAVRQYVSDNSGRFVMQAPEEMHKRLQELLDATKRWEDSSRMRAREQNPIVTSVAEGQYRLEWRTMGLVLGSQREVERKLVGKYLTIRITGLEIIGVEPGSPSAWLTMEPNDTLTRISNFEIQSSAVLKSIVETFLDTAGPAQRTITFIKADGEQRSGHLPPAQPNRESAGEQGSDHEETAPDDWLRDVAFASPKDREIARRAWKELGIKFIPLSESELEAVRRGGFQGGLKVLGLEREMNVQGPLFVTHVQSKRLAAGIGDFAALERALDALAAQAADELIVLQGIKTGGGVFQYSMRRPQAGPGNVNAQTDLLVREIAELRRKKAAIEAQLWKMHTESATAKSGSDDPKPANSQKPQSELVQLEEGHQAQAIASLQQQLIDINETLEKVTKDVKNRVERSLELEEANAALERESKFPSLEEQKLADLAYKRLGLELEPISDNELQRVKALGYDGGVKVAFGRLNPENGQYGSFEFGDILVGLHVWPTTSLKQVAEILARDDLAELNPIKFYVVRRDPSVQPAGGGYGGYRSNPRLVAQGPNRSSDSRDTIVTGRITVRLEPQARVLPPPSTTPFMPTPGEVEDTAPKTSAQPDLPSTPGGLKVYFFHSEDSAPSRDMKSVIERITKVPPGAEFIEFDVNEQPELAKQMNITRVPTCVFMRDGTELGRINGAQTEHELRNAIRTILKSNELPSAPTATVPPRLFDPNDRTETPGERVVKTFDSEAPAEDVKAAIEAVTEAGSMEGPVEVEVVPHDGKSALVIRGPAASNRAIAPSRANLRYEGKTFDEWRDAWRTELSTQKRLDAVKALAAFGSAGSDAIEPPDILLINAKKIVPKSPHSIEPFDGLLIRASGLSPGAPIADAFVVDPEGKVDLGPRYGSVSVGGMTTDEARETIHKHLVKRTSDEDPLDEQIDVSVSLAFAAGAQQIVGEHVVGPDGRINLGTYGSVHVAGKTIDEARRAIEAHLAKYLEHAEVVVDTLGNNGGRNYAKEAADAIIAVAGQYDWSKSTGNGSLISLRQACLDAFGSNSGSLPAQLPANEALAALLRATDSPAAAIRKFAATALRIYARNNSAALEAIVKLSRDSDASVGEVAWDTLFAVYTPDSPAVFARVREALACDQPRLQIGALRAIYGYDLRKNAPRSSNAGIRNVPEIFQLLFSDDPEVCGHARRALQRIVPEEVSGIVPQLLEVLQDVSRSNDHVKTIRALGAIGRGATPAVESLTQLLVSDKNSLRISAAAALQAILGERDFNKLLGDTIAAELKIDVREDGVVSMPGQPDSKIFSDFIEGIEAERRAVFP